jgi:hypothetical protein
MRSPEIEKERKAGVLALTKLLLRTKLHKMPARFADLGPDSTSLDDETVA